MIATIGFVFAIGLLVYMIIRGIDMITATVVTAAVILVTSGLNVWDGFLTTYSGGIGSFVTSWFLILGLGGVFGQLVLEASIVNLCSMILLVSLRIGTQLPQLGHFICLVSTSYSIIPLQDSQRYTEDSLLSIVSPFCVFIIYSLADNNIIFFYVFFVYKIWILFPQNLKK